MTDAPPDFTPDRMTYIRSHATLAAVAMAGGMIILWAVGNPYVWTGAIGGLAAVIVRGWYLMDEELAQGWALTDTGLKGTNLRFAGFDEIAKLRSLGSAVQIITNGGDKHLIKYQPAPDDTIARITTAMRAAGHVL
ncbi:MAG: hypothetical protein QNJ09_10540 [Paracoccaceae bacterium]|nr:hypothetical protein [Paracoccaceae bacterium]